MISVNQGKGTSVLKKLEKGGTNNVSFQRGNLLMGGGVGVEKVRRVDTMEDTM